MTRKECVLVGTGISYLHIFLLWHFPDLAEFRQPFHIRSILVPSMQLGMWFSALTKSQNFSALIRLCSDSQNKNLVGWHSSRIPLCRNMTSPVRSIWLLHAPPHTKEHYFSFNASYMRAFGVCLCYSEQWSQLQCEYLMNMHTHRWTHPMWLVRNEISSSRRTCVDSCTLLLNFCRGQKEEKAFTTAFIY